MFEDEVELFGHSVTKFSLEESCNISEFKTWAIIVGDKLQFEFVFGESRLELSLLALLCSNREASEEGEECCLRFCMLYSNGISISTISMEFSTWALFSSQSNYK